MTVNEAIQQLDLLEKKSFAFRSASAALYLDAVTVAPAGSGEGRGLALGILAGESQKLMTSEETGELLGFLNAHRDELDAVHARQVEVLYRDYQKLTKIPAEEYMAYATLINDADVVWHKAKAENDYAAFKPYLEKIVEYNRKFAGYVHPEMAPYDALLDDYEKGLTVAYLDPFFDRLRRELVPVIKAIGEKPQPDDSFLHRDYPVEDQKRMMRYLTEVMGLNKDYLSVGETEHPFMMEFNNKDVRIETKYRVNDVADSMFSIIHESGHALYEMNVEDKYQYTCLSGGTSMGVHESQSRFYENIVGRSEGFIQAVFPKLQEIFPEQLKDVTAHQFFLAVNKVRPSLIRIEADEMTYPLHVMIRYEIEKQLIGGTLSAEDVPGEWNRLYKEYLGVDVPDDSRGCLQDSHWSGGLIGYFPSYALGSAYGAQMLHNMSEEMDVWGPVAEGDLSHISAWLKEKIHKFGSFIDAPAAIERACGRFDPAYSTDYLIKKYTAIYDL